MSDPLKPCNRPEHAPPADVQRPTLTEQELEQLEQTDRTIYGPPEWDTVDRLIADLRATKEKLRIANVKLEVAVGYVNGMDAQLRASRAEVERLRIDNESLNYLAREISEARDRIAAERDVLGAEVERLRAGNL